MTDTPFYVYILARPNRKPFYVGKGKGPRVFAHEDEAKRGCSCPKCKVIRSIWSKGGEVQRYIVYTTTDSADALRYEAELMLAIGRHRLTNQVDGGGGTKNMSPRLIAQIAATRARRKIDRDAYWTRERERLKVMHEARIQQMRAQRTAALEAERVRLEEIRKLITEGELRWMIGPFIEQMNVKRLAEGSEVLTAERIAVDANIPQKYLNSLIDGTAKSLKCQECGNLLRYLKATVPDLIRYVARTEGA